jgi:hypothetical protein
MLAQSCELPYSAIMVKEDAKKERVHRIDFGLCKVINLSERIFGFPNFKYYAIAEGAKCTSSNKFGQVVY